MVKLELPQDFKELLNILLNHEVKFLVVGGYAVAFHGHPRFTGDIDIWINRSIDNAKKVVLALKEFGFDTPNLKSEMFTAEDSLTRMGVEPMKVELFTHIPGLQFDQSFAKADIVNLPGAGDIPFICLDDLKESKKTSGRMQDLADLEKL